MHIQMTISIKEEHTNMHPDQDYAAIDEKCSDIKDESHFPTGIRLVTIIASILLAMFLVALV